MKCPVCNSDIPPHEPCCGKCGCCVPDNGIEVPRSRFAYIMLALFFGGLGIHNFYAGRVGCAFAQLFLTVFSWIAVVVLACRNALEFSFVALCVSLGGLCLWVLIEVIVVTSDGQGNPFRD